MSHTTDPNHPTELALREYGLSFPGTREDFPWGHRALKVGAKVFVFMGADDKGWGLSVKLPVSANEALALPFALPTGYGLGKSGWVSAQFPKGEVPPLGLLKRWVRESYCAIAPKKLAALLEAQDAGGSAGFRPAISRAAAAGSQRARKNPTPKAVARKTPATKASTRQAPARKARASKRSR
jgi:predicted DNA-binding protein (MmcQ/YjbR family)